jgi:hypothetical protein
MYDDGAHNDGAAGDKKYGAEITMSADFVEYYVYAENADAGKFSPQRAEHEFYILYANVSTIKKGDLVINELMADNASTIMDSNGDYDDWIELYNNTSATLLLDNLFLSDSYSSPQKWKFTNGTTIGPKSYLIVWADDDASQAGIHATFKLSASGEKAILSYADGYVVDSISFGAQTADISFLRCPNGKGSFKLNAPSFGTENCITVATEEYFKEDFLVYPNPSSDKIFINNDQDKINSIQIYQSSGQQVWSKTGSFSSLIEVDLFGNSPGIYFVKINNTSFKKIVLL